MRFQGCIGSKETKKLAKKRQRLCQCGSSTPYFYSADGTKEAYVRVGNESVPAPDYILRELVLKGTNCTYDSLLSDSQKSDHSFTLLEATYLERTGLHFSSSDYISFGLATRDGILTNAGKLLTDQYSVYNSRVFCTRWNGLTKTSIFDDAVDDREFEGNLIYLLQSARDFIRNNSKVRFEKKGEYRIDKPDYSERAITEALVNALIHRDYLVLGSEVHIDMYDDRLEIYSPGGMFQGKAIQDCAIDAIDSSRRNPVIADLFHRMKFMERRGSGLCKILDETAKLPGYTEDLMPIFKSTGTAFWVIIKNVNYALQIESSQDDSNVVKKSGEIKAEEKSGRKKAEEKSGRKKVTSKTAEHLTLISSYMQPDIWYKASEFESVTGLKKTRLNELLELLENEGIIESSGITKAKLYRKKPL